MLGLIYDIVMSLAVILLAPYFIIAGFIRDRKLLNYISIFRQDQKTSPGQKKIWVHASSVGEVKAAYEVIDRIHAKSPQSEFMLTVFTSRGMTVAEQMKLDFVTNAYLPFDAGFLIADAIDSFRPSILIITETELWPNLIRKSVGRGIPVCIINGRISDKSCRNYLMFRSLFAPLLQKMSFIHCQSAGDRDRFIALGSEPETTLAGNNVKIASMLKSLELFDRTAILSELGLSETDRVFIAGSTRDGEVSTILDALQLLRESHPKLKLILAPRHPKRVPQVRETVERAKFSAVNRSEIESANTEEDVIILDTLGELWRMYGIGVFAFVGGSLVPIGGHNPLEPIALGVPTCFGPYMQNSKDIAKFVLENGIAAEVHNAREIAEFGLRCMNGDVSSPESRTIVERFGNDADLVADRILSELAAH